MPNARHSRHSRASGFSLVEFLLVSVPILLLTLGGIELAHWFHVRQMVGLALVQAARAGATQHAQPAVIAQTFEQALRPLFAGASTQTTDARLARVMRQRADAMNGGPPWQIRIVRPDARDFVLFSTPTLAIARNSGLSAIRNDYQYEQQHAYTSSGISTDGHATVFQANTLVLRLSYPHAPLLPGVARLLSNVHVHAHAYARRALAAGLLPMTREVQLDMASHPVDWPSLPDGRVIKGQSADNTADDYPATPCVGLWCQPQTPQTSPEAGQGADGMPVWGAGDGATGEPSFGDGDDAGDALPDDLQCP